MLFNTSIGLAGNDGISDHSNDASYENAITNLKAGLLKNPEDMVSHQTLAQLYMMNGNYDQAIAEANWILKKDKQSLFALSILTSGYFYKNEYDKSIEAGQRMLVIDNQFADVHKMIGQSYKSKGDYEKASEYFSKAINITPTDMIARNNLSSVYLKLNNLSKALAVTLESEKIDHENPLTLYVLARIYARKGDSANAINWLRKAIGINTQLKEEAKAADDFSHLQKLKEFQELILR